MARAALHDSFHTSDLAPMMGEVFFAELICSDPKCGQRVEEIGTLEELETLACECGCGLVIVSLRELDGELPVRLEPGVLAEAA